MSVSKLLDAAFATAQVREPQRLIQWRDVSYRLGSRLPNSLLVSSIQKIGNFDVLLLSLEKECADEANGGSARPFMSFHHQMMFSEHFVGASYEAMRTIAQRERDRAKAMGDEQSGLAMDAGFRALLVDLELVRIALEKHEIPKERELDRPLELTRTPPSGEERDRYIYDRSDSGRSHIMPTGITAGGSVCWHVIDLKRKANYWVERRNLADRLLALAV